MISRSLARVLVVSGFAVAGCGDGSTDSGRRVTIEFVYLASTSTDPAVAEQHPTCVTGVGRTHIHPSWLAFGPVGMTAVQGPERWQVTLTGVPAGQRHSVRINDPNACATDRNGATTRNVYANGVLLTEAVGTPGNGIEPGLGFRVSPDGEVLP